MKMKKVLSIALVIVLAIGMLAGCGGGSTSEAAKNFSETDEKLTLEWLGYAVLPGCEEGTVPELALEEKFNVDIKPLFYESEKFNDKKTMLMAGGDIPDLVYELDPVNVYNDVDQDFIVELPYETVEKYAPTYYEYLNNHTPAAWSYSRYLDANWGIPNLNYYNKLPGVLGYRADWLEKAGMDVPETLDELHDVLDYFVHNDPDGDGADDTFGYSMIMNRYSYFFPEFFGAYGVLPFDWQEVDGEIVYGGLREECTEVLQILADWYKEGLIHPDFAAGTDQNALVTADKIGYIQYVSYQDESNPVSQINTLRQVVPGADFAYGTAPYGPDGLRGVRTWGTPCHVVAFGNTEQYGVAVPRMLQILEGIFTDNELAETVAYGNEGEHYTKLDKAAYTGFSIYSSTKEYTDYAAMRLAGITASTNGPSFFAAITPPEEFYYDGMTDAYRTWLENYAPADAALTDVFYKVDIIPSAADYLVDLRNKQMALMAEVVQGTKPAESYLTEFAEIWSKGGGDIMLEEAKSHQEVLQGMYKDLGIK